MNRWHQSILALIAALLCSAPAVSAKEIKAGNELIGQTLYNQTNLWTLKGERTVWANYHVDTMVPINAEIVVEEIDGEDVTFTVRETGQRIDLDNNDKSGLDGAAWAKRQFGPQKVDLARFTAAERKAIDNGLIELGMSKDAVIAAYGYPPRHVTPLLSGNQWSYWMNRWDRQVFYFDAEGKLVSIKD